MIGISTFYSDRIVSIRHTRIWEIFYRSPVYINYFVVDTNCESSALYLNRGGIELKGNLVINETFS